MRLEIQEGDLRERQVLGFSPALLVLPCDGAEHCEAALGGNLRASLGI